MNPGGSGKIVKRIGLLDLQMEHLRRAKPLIGFPCLVSLVRLFGVDGRTYAYCVVYGLRHHEIPGL